MQTTHDIPMLIFSDNSHSERRITPSWTIGQLKLKLEAVTGVPPQSQRLTLGTGASAIPIEAADEENTQLSGFPLAPYAELYVGHLYSGTPRDVPGLTRMADCRHAPTGNASELQ